MHLESQEIGAEQTGQDLAAPGQLHEQFARGERDVQEEADVDVGAQFAQHLWDELELVVVHPHRAAGRDVLGHGRGETHVDRAVRVPPRAVERGRADGVVIERPDRGVGEPEIELLVLLGADRHGLQSDAFVRRWWRLILGRAGPADPQSLAVLQDRGQRRNEPAGTRQPTFLTWCAGVSHRQTVGDDDEVGWLVGGIDEGVLGNVGLRRFDWG